MMAGYILQNKKDYNNVKTEPQKIMKSPVDTISDTSGSQYDSYCELSSDQGHNYHSTLAERQNSQNEEKEGQKWTVNLKQCDIYDNKYKTKQPEQTKLLPPTDLCDKIPAFKDDTQVTINDPIKSKFSSTDSDWTDDGQSKRTAKIKSRYLRCCCCKVVIPGLVSAAVSIFVIIFLSVAHKSKIVLQESPEPPKLDQLTAAELRNTSGLQSFLSTKSRAQLYLDQKALKDRKKLLWTTQDLQDAFISQDLSTSVYAGTYGCLVVSKEGFYSIFSKVTFFYDQNTEAKIFYHTTNLWRNGVFARELAANKYTPPPKNTRPSIGNNYWPSILPGVFHLIPNDQVCILVNHIERVYAGPTHNFLNMYMLSNY